VNERPAYKSHPLWIEAMSLTREAYALSERLRDGDPEASQRLRRAAVAVPAHVASALSVGYRERREPMQAARGALADVSQEALRASVAGASRLADQAALLDRRVLFEFGAPDLAS
jgi:23S rRNA-intervening sequence protein